MQRLLKSIFYISIILILLLIILCIVRNLLPVEFTNQRDETIYSVLIFLGIPVATILTLAGTLKKNDTRDAIIIKVLFTLVAAFIPIFLTFITALDGMCVWNTERVLFENKKMPSEKIVLRSFGCGAVDSGSPSYSVFKIKYYTSYLIWISNIDTTKIDRQIWTKITGKEEQE